MSTKPLDTIKYDTDKCNHPHYLRSYEAYLEPLREQEVTLFELGIYKGGSLQLWRDYFTKGTIVGLDLNPVAIDDPSGRIRIYQGEQQDTELLTRIARETAPAGFDVIIDDCSHIGELTRISFWHLFDNHLKPGGLYVIEDWSASYWDNFFDGVSFNYKPRLKFSDLGFKLRSKIAQVPARAPALNGVARAAKRLLNRKQFRSHQYGLVGFIKELVDECGMADITRKSGTERPLRESKFREMRIFPGQVFITKA